MKRISVLLVGLATLDGVAFRVPASGQTDVETTPIYGVKIPPGYRDWTLISVARVGGSLSDMRAKLGNDVAIRAFREGEIPFPDGTIIARLAWNQVTSDENNSVHGLSIYAHLKESTYE